MITNNDYQVRHAGRGKVQTIIRRGIKDIDSARKRQRRNAEKLSAALQPPFRFICAARWAFSTGKQGLSSAGGAVF